MVQKMASKPKEQQSPFPRTKEGSPLGSIAPTPSSLPGFEEAIAKLSSPDFLDLTRRKRFGAVNKQLLEMIEQSPEESFLLPAVLDYIDHVNQAKVLDMSYAYTLWIFEFWLNQISGVSQERNFAIRAKIAGKRLPRSAYQGFFPIGMGKQYPGSHFSVAHLSPDVDTMVASFFGWLDSFAARVAEGQHIWALPGGAPDSPVSAVMKRWLGQGIFRNVARTATALTLSAMDLLSTKNLLRVEGDVSAPSLEHGADTKAIVLVDEDEHFLGDWRVSDVEPVQQILLLFRSCLRWFENNFHQRIVALFATKELTNKEIPPFVTSIFDCSIGSTEPTKELAEAQREALTLFLERVLGIRSGVEATFSELFVRLAEMGVHGMQRFEETIRSLPDSPLFDESGRLIEDRPQLFHQLQAIIAQLDLAIHATRTYTDRLDIAAKVKREIRQISPTYVFPQSDVKDLKEKMGNFSHLTVVVQDNDDCLYPMGVIAAEKLRQEVLGTVSQRDFCNEQEAKMASYLRVISVIDHHKAELSTVTAPLALLGDAQACNTIVAEETFRINDRFSSSNQTAASLQEQIKELAGEPKNSSLLQRTAKRQTAIEGEGTWFIHPEREFAEYLLFLHAILDDTDLLTKVSDRDVLCVAELLNRMASIAERREVEVVSLTDIPQDEHFARASADRLLQSQPLYSIYEQVYDLREKEVDFALAKCQDASTSPLFADTKIQSGCCRVGQTKLFSSNYPTYAKHREELIRGWLEVVRSTIKARPEIDLHLHMISTIASAQEVYEGRLGEHSHKDELWVWAAPHDEGLNHLSQFLTTFLKSPPMRANHPSVEIVGKETAQWRKIFSRFQLEITSSEEAETIPSAVALLRFDAGTLNSRKTMVTPYLPKLLD